MQTTSHFKQVFKELKTCVLIPTYNNAGSLPKVITDVSAYCDDIIVVNDGSTDQTETVLNQFPGLQKISYQINKGKGWALRTGFVYALNQGYEFAITIDSDGQHFAKDLPVFLEKLQSEKNAIIIGARNMNQESVPGGSSFGNKFSNFWFKVETGISVPDTQSGYRLYPLQPVAGKKYFTRKYEFEIEVLVRAAWKEINILSVPVNVYYAPVEERVSHFRPYKDFARIGVLNTILVLITLLYVKPLSLLRDIGKKEFWQKVRDLIIAPGESSFRKALSLGFGVFMGIAPIWGFQLVSAIFLSFVFKMNKALVIIGVNISVPPMIPFILYGSYKLGALWMGSRAMTLSFTNGITLNSLGSNLEQYIYGAISLAVLAGLLLGLVGFVVFKFIPRKTAITS